MKRTILLAFVATLPLALCVPSCKLRGLCPHAAKMPHRCRVRPAVVGGTGATAGPNFENQSVVPIPAWSGAERATVAWTITPPDVRPVPARHPRSARSAPAQATMNGLALAS